MQQTKFISEFLVTELLIRFNCDLFYAMIEDKILSAKSPNNFHESTSSVGDIKHDGWMLLVTSIGSGLVQFNSHQFELSDLHKLIKGYGLLTPHFGQLLSVYMMALVVPRTIRKLLVSYITGWIFFVSFRQELLGDFLTTEQTHPSHRDSWSVCFPALGYFLCWNKMFILSVSGKRTR